MVFTQIFRWLTIGLVWGQLVACNSYRTLQIDIPRPAAVTLESWGPIAVLGRNTVNNSDYISRWLPQEEMILHFVDGMNAGLTDCGRTDSVIPLRESDQIVLKDNQLPEELDASRIAELCRGHDVDYIAELIFCENQIDLAKNEVSGKLHIRLYSGISLKLLDSVTFSDRYWYAREAFEAGVVEDEIAESVWNNGLKYAGHILPHWQTTTRRVYTGGRVLKLGDYFFTQGDTVQAIKMWQLASSSSLDKAMKAAINIAWLWEAEGDLVQALNVMDECRKRPDWNGDSTVGKYFLNYYAILEERIKESEMLIRQSQI